MTDAKVRQRVVTWTDPLALAAHAARTPGLEFLRKMQSGELPAPLTFHLMGFSLVGVSKAPWLLPVILTRYITTLR